MATFTAISQQQAQSFVTEFDLGRCVKLTPIPAGSVNSNFVLDVENAGALRRFFLRVFEEQGVEGARYDAALLAHLAKRGVPTPEPCVRRDGDPLAMLGDKPVAMFPFVEGVHTCQRAVDEARMRSLGRALAALHLAGRDFPIRRAGRFTLDDVRARLPKIASAQDPSLAEMAPKIAQKLDEHVARRATSLPTGVVHGDLFRDNVLFRRAEGAGHDDIVALLDFESASDGPFAYDLAVTVLAWCFGDTLDTELARSLIEGYASVRPLEQQEREGLRTELAIAALRFTTTRITDYAMPRAGVGERVIKDWRRFWARLGAVEAEARVPW
jgi:homoserine kinase type II